MPDRSGPDKSQRDKSDRVMSDRDKAGPTKPAPEKSGFDPLTLPESNATSYPEPYRAANQQRWSAASAITQTSPISV